MIAAEVSDLAQQAAKVFNDAAHLVSYAQDVERRARRLTQELDTLTDTTSTREAALEAEIARLHAENARLRDRLATGGALDSDERAATVRR